MSEEPEVIIDIEGVAGRITLNRPRALNALTTGMCVAICDALLAWQDDGHVELVLIDGAGDRAFCAGGDIRMLAASGAGDGSEARRFFAAEYRMNELLHRYAKPVVAIMDGITMGGGVGIAMPARCRVATERTKWAMPEGDIGLFPDVGAGWHLPRLNGQAGAWLGLTGARLEAADCKGLGIATHFTPSTMVEALKAAVVEGSGMDWLETDPGPAPIVAFLPMIDRLFAHDTVEAIMDALAADGSDWALAQREILARKCPTTLEVTLRLIRLGARRAKFADEMQVEYRAASRMIHRHDFIEGVRAVIIDKDNAPRWEPNTLLGVTEGMLDLIFAELPPEEEWTRYSD